jgi:hypothetical protein
VDQPSRGFFMENYLTENQGTNQTLGFKLILGMNGPVCRPRLGLSLEPDGETKSIAFYDNLKNAETPDASIIACIRLVVQDFYTIVARVLIKKWSVCPNTWLLVAIALSAGLEQATPGYW